LVPGCSGGKITSRPASKIFARGIGKLIRGTVS
jgi:hypothetical protein